MTASPASVTVPILTTAIIEDGKLTATYLPEYRKLIVATPRYGVWFDQDGHQHGKAKIGLSKRGDRSSRGLAISTTYGQFRHSDALVGHAPVTMRFSLSMVRKQYERLHGNIDIVQDFESTLPQGPFPLTVLTQGSSFAMSTTMVAFAVDTETQPIPPAEGNALHRISLRGAGSDLETNYAGTKIELKLFAGYNEEKR
jgi:hypothetical protein